MNFSCSYLGFIYIDTDIYRFNVLAISVILLCLSIPTIVCNFLIYVTIYKKTDLHQPSFYIIANLAVSDFLAGCSSFVCYAVICIHFFTGRDPCHVAVYGTFIGYTLCIVTGLTVLFQIVDRYIATFYSFWYREKFTSGRVLKINLIIWILSTCCVIYYAVSKHEKVFFSSLVLAMTVLLVTNLFCNIKIFRRIKQIKQEIQEQKRNIWGRKGTKSDSKIVRVTVMIVTSLLICYTPFATVLVYIILDGKRTTALSVSWYWGWLLSLLNSSINPVITCSQLTVIRKAVFNLFPETDKRREDFSNV